MQKSVESLIAQKKESEKDLLKIPGVNAVDVGFKYVNGKRTEEVVIRVHVSKKKKNVPESEMIPAEINGIKTDVIEGTYNAQITSQKKVPTVGPQADTVNYRPLKGGISIGPDRSIGGFIFAGTLGCFAKDNASGQTLMLSNFHVMCVDNSWSAGDVIDQPSLIDTGTSSDNVGTINRAVLSAHVDGAVANINSGIGSTATIPGIGNIAGTAAAVLNAPVRKRGRTTLLTYGFIDGLSGTVNVNYEGALGTRTFTDQIFIRPDTSQNPSFSDHGDSGSAIVDASNNVVGLLFAGDASFTVANPIAFVEAELNVTILKYTRIKRKLEKLEIKEIKEFKLEKHEFKEAKSEKFELKEKEKLEFKEIEKPFKEIDTKFDDKFNEVIIPDNPIDPIQDLPTGLEQRIQQLENTVNNLSSFINSSLRPDLSQGALSNE